MLSAQSLASPRSLFIHERAEFRETHAPKSTRLSVLKPQDQPNHVLAAIDRCGNDIDGPEAIDESLVPRVTVEIYTRIVRFASEVQSRGERPNSLKCRIGLSRWRRPEGREIDKDLDKVQAMNASLRIVADMR